MSKKIIDANHRSIVPDFKELFRYKDLFLTLAWRDFRGSVCANSSVSVIVVLILRTL